MSGFNYTIMIKKASNIIGRKQGTFLQRRLKFGHHIEFINFIFIVHNLWVGVGSTHYIIPSRIQIGIPFNFKY